MRHLAQLAAVLHNRQVNVKRNYNTWKTIQSYKNLTLIYPKANTP